MRYFLQAIEVKTGYQHEEEVSSPGQYEKLKKQLEKTGEYRSFRLDERWSDLNEMYAALD